MVQCDHVEYHRLLVNAVGVPKAARELSVEEIVVDDTFHAKTSLMYYAWDVAALSLQTRSVSDC